MHASAINSEAMLSAIEMVAYVKERTDMKPYFMRKNC